MIQTVTFQSVYEAVARRHGLDPLGGALVSDTGRQIAKKITDRAMIAWQSWDFAELTRTEERAFRQVWNNTDQYSRLGAEGLPDEVYYLVNMKYYRVKSLFTDPPLGTAPTNTTYFEEIAPEPYIDREQRCRRTIGQVLGVYKTDPSLNTNGGIDLALPFRPSEHGIRVMGDYGSTVFVWYMLPEPEYTIAPYIGGKSYVRGDRVFYGKPVGDGNCYRALNATSTHLPTDTDFWAMEAVPASLATYLEAGAYSDCLRDTIFNGVDEPTRMLRLQTSADEAMTHLARKIDTLIGQGQKHFYGGNRWWKYSGNGMWSSQPWGGDRVWPLTDVCVDDSTFTPPDTSECDTSFHPEIVALLTATGTPSLQGLDTTKRAITCTKISIVVVVSGSPEVQEWQLYSGAADPLDAGHVAPANYDATTNNKHWVKVG